MTLNPFFEVASGYRNTIVGEIYRIPNTDETFQYNDMKKLLKKKYCKQVIIGSLSKFLLYESK